MDTVTAAKQELFLERLLFTFSVRKKQCRNASTARITGEAWEQLLETSCLLFQLLVDMWTAKDKNGDPVFQEEDLAKARRRGVEGFPASEYIERAGARDSERTTEICSRAKLRNDQVQERYPEAH